MNILKLQGTEKLLYELVAPLVMSPAVLRQNNNYPFKTSHNFVWYVAVDDSGVMGFMPVKKTNTGNCIDNYFVSGDDEGLLNALLDAAISGVSSGTALEAVVHKRHVANFAERGFVSRIEWKKYDKMQYSPLEKRRRCED